MVDNKSKLTNYIIKDVFRFSFIHEIFENNHVFIGHFSFDSRRKYFLTGLFVDTLKNESTYNVEFIRNDKKAAKYF